MTSALPAPNTVVQECVQSKICLRIYAGMTLRQKKICSHTLRSTEDLLMWVWKWCQWNCFVGAGGNGSVSKVHRDWVQMDAQYTHKNAGCGRASMTPVVGKQRWGSDCHKALKSPTWQGQARYKINPYPSMAKSGRRKVSWLIPGF